ncbi:cobaltochelatase subunit CobN [Pyrobaculum neutrophilum]|uniref:cobaltochelatase subunit CobN n=1 Tax=Pyrobaculum neutrophilum TaxID=70771 RepID=UPI00016190DE|nr:cobaltochelatase subunit CobN [Pyrobaculum neutrophilum]
MLRLSFIVGYGGSMLPVLAKVAEEEAKKLGFEYLVTSDAAASAHADFLKESDAVLIYTHQLAPEVESAIRRSRAKVVVSLNPEYHPDIVRGRPDLWIEARRYFVTGGEKNLRNVVRLLLRELGVAVEVEDVEPIPWDGIYHPKYGVFTDLEEYMRRYEKRGEETVGILFYRTNWLYGNTKHVDRLIEEFEKEGVNVIAVFTYGFRDDILKAPSKEESAARYFIRGGRPVVDAVVNLTSFFILDRGRWTLDPNRMRVADGVGLLKMLNVPIITPAQSSRQTVREWLDSPEGIDYMSQVYYVVMPEVDGGIEPFFLVGTRVNRDGAKVADVYEPHVSYLVRRVKRWIRLSRKSPSERKIAIVLINPPCKGLEANVGVGLGLDVPESVVRLLKRLRELGYIVGGEIPESGQALIKLILSRKAISEFRWTSVETIVKSGGAVGFVDLDTYMRWFNELPPDVREKMVKDWGRPADVLGGRFNKLFVGMVYQGKFVIPGVVFGNVLIMPQPKFGCAGPRCDGRVCRILHDPTISPPHQWLAAYRWATRVFGADVLIHFGTHGALEFRPGKGVGLDVSSWPEISVDDVPHLYVYAFTNPMEGVIAKRRSYAVIIDHLYPPMDTAEVFEQLEKLVNDYWRAKQNGNYEQAKILYAKIREEAEKAHVKPRVKTDDPDDYVEEVHNYLRMVSDTEINLGLHIFGHPTSDVEKLARYGTTIFLKDTARYPSVVRALAEYLGFDYDELRRRPGEVNKLGMTNDELLKKLKEMAYAVSKRLVESGYTSAGLTEEAVVKAVEEVRTAFGL